jgi:hypothetical protein
MTTPKHEIPRPAQARRAMRNGASGMTTLQHVPLELTQDAVMAVLVTAIHVFAARQDVDARDKPAHDGAILCDRNML